MEDRSRHARRYCPRWHRRGCPQGRAEARYRTPDALKRTLLKAKSITYAQDGASRVYLEKMFDRLGTAKTEAEDHPGAGLPGAGTRVANGGAEMVMTLVSEILPMPGVELVATSGAVAELRFLRGRSEYEGRQRGGGQGVDQVSHLTGGRAGVQAQGHGSLGKHESHPFIIPPQRPHPERFAKIDIALRQ